MGLRLIWLLKQAWWPEEGQRAGAAIVANPTITPQPPPPQTSTDQSSRSCWHRGAWAARWKPCRWWGWSQPIAFFTTPGELPCFLDPCSRCGPLLVGWGGKGVCTALSVFWHVHLTVLVPVQPICHYTSYCPNTLLNTLSNTLPNALPNTLPNGLSNALPNTLPTTFQPPNNAPTMPQQCTHNAPRQQQARRGGGGARQVRRR